MASGPLNQHKSMAMGKGGASAPTGKSPGYKKGGLVGNPTESERATRIQGAGRAAGRFSKGGAVKKSMKSCNY